MVSSIDVSSSRRPKGDSLQGGFGCTIQGAKYELVQRLNAEGGNAEVWKAKRLDFDSTCVLKKTTAEEVTREVKARKVVGWDNHANFALEVQLVAPRRLS